MKTSEAELVYSAQHELDFFIKHGGLIDFYGSKLYIEPCERKFARPEDAQRFLEQVREHVGVTQRVPTIRTNGNRKSWAHYFPLQHEIRVPPHRPGDPSWALRERVILHEYAHSLTRGHGHDATFCAALAMLLRQCMTPEIGAVFEKLMAERGVQPRSFVVQ